MSFSSSFSDRGIRQDQESFDNRAMAYATPAPPQYVREYELEPTQTNLAEMQQAEEEEDGAKGTTTDKVVCVLLSLSSLLNKLYLQSHLIHLNIEGPLFLSLHAFYKEQYETNIGLFDKAAELIRTLDYMLPMCEKGLNTACEEFAHVEDYNGREMSMTYLSNLDTCMVKAKEVAAAAKEADAIDVDNFAADVVASVCKSSWQLKATLR